MTARVAQTIRVNPVGEDFAFVAIVVDGWSIRNIRVRGGQVEWPYTEGKENARYHVATPPAEIRDALEAEIVAAVERAQAR